MTDLAVADQSNIIEQVVIQGDLAKLSPADRVRYYREVCRSLGLNELTRPFEYIVLNNKLTLYARKDCTDQLRKSQSVSITKLEREKIDDLYVVTAYATNKTGRSDSAIGAVNVKGLGGDNLANALMKCETKAKRRVTLSLCGLGWTDESEVESIPAAATVVVDQTTGEVLEQSGGYVPTDDRTDLQDRDMVRSADDDLWKRWEKLRDHATELGLKVQKIALPTDRNDLYAYGVELAAHVKERERQAEAIGTR